MLSRIPWDQNIRAEAVEAIFMATVEGPDTPMEIYACHEKAISSLIWSLPSMDDCCLLGSGPEGRFNYQPGSYLDGSKKLETVKVGELMSHELKQYLRQRGKLCL